MRALVGILKLVVEARVCAVTAVAICRRHRARAPGREAQLNASAAAVKIALCIVVSWN